MTTTIARLAGLAVALTFFSVPVEAFQTAHPGLPPEAPMQGTVITVDISKNTAYLFQDGRLLKQGRVATGMDKVLRKGGRVWLFRTPRGRHEVLGKIANPVWTKPDWAYIEEGKPVPHAGDPSRKVKGKMGRYALDLGDGILIHGTDDPKSIGTKASHGCIRMARDMLETVWKHAPIGTQVYLFDSSPTFLAEKGVNDLDLWSVSAP